jgi:3-oxoacyl-[acyl-carrier protein] reductase
MDMQLKGKRALVTGSSSGIGRAIAEMLAGEGVQVVVHGRDAVRVRAVRDGIETNGNQAAMALGDLTAEAEAEAVIDAAQQAFGGIDILINNIGGAISVGNKSWFDADIKEWAQSFQYNIIAAVRLIHSFVPAMKERGWGRVIQISSRNAISPYADLSSYGAAKAAVNNLTLSLSKELAGTGVTSNGVMPGLIYTPQLDAWFLEMAQKHVGSSDVKLGRDYVLKNIVKQTVDRLGQPQDIASFVCYLASPVSDFMTGTTVRLDGGSTPTI